MNDLSALLLPSLVGFSMLIGCSSEPICNVPPGQGKPAGCEEVRTRTGTGGSSGADACTEVQVSSNWELLPTGDPLYRLYTARITPNFGVNNPDSLLLIMWDDEIGTFDFGVGVDSNHETCLHCLFLESDAPRESDTFFLATSGTLRVDPPSKALKGRLEGEGADIHFDQVIIDVTYAHSTKVPGGSCFHLDHTQISVAGTIPE